MTDLSPADEAAIAELRRQISEMRREIEAADEAAIAGLAMIKSMLQAVSRRRGCHRAVTESENQTKSTVGDESC
jgi:chorismate mutase